MRHEPAYLKPIYTICNEHEKGTLQNPFPILEGILPKNMSERIAHTFHHLHNLTVVGISYIDALVAP